MHYIGNRIDYFIGIVISILSAVFGKFWFLFAFLLLLNVLDYITGIMKAKYLKKESSRIATKGFFKKVFIWTVIAVAFGLSFIFVVMGRIAKVNMNFMNLLGWFVLIHAIINECRSILENIVECDKGHIVPHWLTKGLEVIQDKIDYNIEQKIDTTTNKKRDEKNNCEKDGQV